MNKPLIAAIVAGIVMIANLVSFLLMKHDKQSAKKGARRVPEKTLFLVCGCFGGLGGVLGMQLLRHKTKHWYFAVFFPLMLVVQAALLVWGGVALFR